VSTAGIPLRRFRYREPPPDGREAKRLAMGADGSGAPSFAFYGRLEIGRDDGARPLEQGLLLIPDPIVSRQHCVVTQHASGRCFVRDVSRNGTRVAGRRLVPNVEMEILVGETLSVGNQDFVLQGVAAGQTIAPEAELGTSTIPQADRRIVTVVVGDIRDYTVLSRGELSENVQRSVSRVFEALGGAVVEHGGSIKEYQGDAILAYWEGDVTGRQALRACKATLGLDALALRIARDRSVWALEDFPLRIDWALCTGLVLIDSIGQGPAGSHRGAQRAGLSMMGEPVVRAFRIEKFASDQTGRILACNMTRDFAVGGFTFLDLGPMQAKGFDRPDRVFALTGERGAPVPPRS
jgi:adenylate cyclase